MSNTVRAGSGDTEQVKRSILESQMSFVDTGGFEFDIYGILS